MSAAEKYKTLSVAVAQYKVSDTSRDANMRNIEEIILSVLSGGNMKPDILLLPELAIEGYAFGDEWDKYQSDCVQNFHSGLAKKYDVNVLA